MGHDDMTAGMRKSLAEVGGALRQTESQERAILKAATDRMAVIDEELGSLKAGAASDPSAAQRYQQLTMEHGRLSKVAAQSKLVLGGGS